MIIHPYEKDKHEHHIIEWLEGHEMNTDLVLELPRIGYIAEESDIGFAAGFIRGMESCRTGMLECLIANPKTFGKKRSNAIDMVVHQIITRSKQLGLKQLISYSGNKGTIRRSERFGFKQMPHVMISLDLGA